MDQQANFVGSIPQEYDAGLGPVIFVDAARDIAGRAAASKPKRVLETAAGTGIVSRQLRDLLPAEAELTVTDINPPMLAVAQEKFRAGERVKFQPADATALPFADASFDAVVCQFGVMFFPDRDKGYREAFRVLAPGGTFLFNLWDSHANNPFGRISHETAASFFPADPPQFQKLPFSLHQLDPIRDALRAAGFAGIDVAMPVWEKEIPDLDRFARGLIYGSPLIEQIRTRGGVDPESIVAKLTANFAAQFGSKPAKMPLRPLIFMAKRPG